MGQVQEDELKELYRQYGETVIKLEYFQAKCMEIKKRIAQLVNK